MKKLFLLLFIILCFASCRTIQTVPEVHTVIDTVTVVHNNYDTLIENHFIHDTTIVSHVEKDSVYHHETTNTYRQNDSVFVVNTITHYEFKFIYDTTYRYILRKDSINYLHSQIDSLQHLSTQIHEVPYEVKVEVKKYPLLPYEISLLVLLLAYFVYKIYKKFHGR